MVIHWKAKGIVSNFFPQKERIALGLTEFLLYLIIHFCGAPSKGLAGMSQGCSQSETEITLRYLKISSSSFGHNKYFNLFEE